MPSWGSRYSNNGHLGSCKPAMSQSASSIYTFSRTIRSISPSVLLSQLRSAPPSPSPSFAFDNLLKNCAVIHQLWLSIEALLHAITRNSWHHSHTQSVRLLLTLQYLTVDIRLLCDTAPAHMGNESTPPSLSLSLSRCFIPRHVVTPYISNSCMLYSLVDVECMHSSTWLLTSLSMLRFQHAFENGGFYQVDPSLMGIFWSKPVSAGCFRPLFESAVTVTTSWARPAK